MEKRVSALLGSAPPGVPPELWARVCHAVSLSPEPLAVFDADGTLWADDLGETHLAVLQERGAVEPGPEHDTLLEEYHWRCARDVDDGYAWGARVLASMDEPAIVTASEEAWQRHRPRLLKPVADILRALSEAGVEVAVVSASNRWAIAAAVEGLGVPADKVVAVDLVRESGRLTSTVMEPMPNGSGKVAAIDTYLGRRPVLAFGNSVHDVPMLASAELGVLILATTPEQEVLTTELEAVRASSDWVWLAVPHPLR